MLAMDGLSQVVYINGFSKTITPVAAWATSRRVPDLAKAFAQTKMAVGLTSSEVTERLVYSVLGDAATTARHVSGPGRATARAAGSRDREDWRRTGMEVLLRPEGDVRVGAPALRGRAALTGRLAACALGHGIWLAPGVVLRTRRRSFRRGSASARGDQATPRCRTFFEACRTGQDCRRPVRGLGAPRRDSPRELRCSARSRCRSWLPGLGPLDARVGDVLEAETRFGGLAFLPNAPRRYRPMSENWNAVPERCSSDVPVWDCTRRPTDASANGTRSRRAFPRAGSATRQTRTGSAGWCRYVHPIRRR